MFSADNPVNLLAAEGAEIPGLTASDCIMQLKEREPKAAFIVLMDKKCLPRVHELMRYAMNPWDDGM